MNLVPLFPENPKQGERFHDKVNGTTWIYLNDKWIDLNEFLKLFKALNNVIYDCLRSTNTKEKEI